MTRNESFKRRVRERMAKTGEKYNAARRVLLEQAPRPSHGWVSAPEHTEDLIRSNTGRGWDDWCALIDAWPGHDEGHGAVAAWLQSEHGVDGWWSQSITNGWERITGRRLPNQMLDGTFTANRSRTIGIAADWLRSTLLDPSGRDLLFPGMEVALRSRPTSKSIRLAFEDGVALLSFDVKDGERITVHVAHEKLPTPEAVSHWKAFWGDWLEALDVPGT